LIVQVLLVPKVLEGRHLKVLEYILTHPPTPECASVSLSFPSSAEVAIFPTRERLPISLASLLDDAMRRSHWRLAHHLLSAFVRLLRTDEIVWLVRRNVLYYADSGVSMHEFYTLRLFSDDSILGMLPYNLRCLAAIFR
jgi:hypothetical protein